MTYEGEFEDEREKLNFPKEVGVLIAGLEGKIKHPKSLGVVRERCKDPRVLAGVTIGLQKRGVEVKPHWIKWIISQCILEINFRIDYGPHQEQVG